MPSASVLPAAESRRGPFKAWHALACFVGFFGFMFVVNGIFLWTAVTTFPGEDVEKSYLTGLDYNLEIDRRQHQQNEGWRAEIGVEGDTTSPLIRIRIVQRDGSALPVSAPTLQLRHPADRANDRILELKAVGQGEYVAEANAVAGIWTAIVVADVDPDTAGQEFKASREVSIK